MEVYRICLTKYATSLQASGRAARWNGKGHYMLYTAGSAALACLENLAHRSGVDLSMANFSIITLEIPDSLRMEHLTETALTKKDPAWFKIRNYPITQEIGNEWLEKGNSALLKVPSAIIQTEHNYLINIGHPDTSKIRIANSEPFQFDQRLFSI